MTVTIESPSFSMLADLAVDITAPRRSVEVNVNPTKKVLWVNVDGVCVLRICRAPSITIEGHPKRRVGQEKPTVSPTELSILRLLMRHRTLSGSEIVAASEGRIKRGSVYVTLTRMWDKGYVKSARERITERGSAIPRRLYKLTPLGARAAAIEEEF